MKKSIIICVANTINILKSSAFILYSNAGRNIMAHKLMASSEVIIDDYFTPFSYAHQEKIGPVIKTSNKPRVLFCHGEYTNQDVASYLLKVTGWTKYFDFIIPAAPYKSECCPSEIVESLGIETLQTKGLYSPNDEYFKWGARFELMQKNIPSDAIPDSVKVEFQENTAEYFKEVDKLHGPFDGVMGFCEGGAALNCALGMKEAGGLDGALDNVKFFVHAAPWVSPLADRNLSSPKHIPTLAIYGCNEPNRGFPESFALYHKSFKGYYDTYIHNGKHDYPIVSEVLENKIKELVKTGNLEHNQHNSNFNLLPSNPTPSLHQVSSKKSNLSESDQDKVLQIISGCLNIDVTELSIEQNIHHEMDSLEVLQMVREIEDDLSIEVDSSTEEEIFHADTTVETIINIVSSIKLSK